MDRILAYSIRARAFVPILLASLLAVSCQGKESGGAAPSSAKPGRLPVHKTPIAGTWYPGDPDELRATLGRFFDAVPNPLPGLEGASPIAVIAPHAGYAYAGQVEAYAMAPLARRATPPDRILILGPTHYPMFQGLAIGKYRAYATPLGEAAIDLAAVERLRRCDLILGLSEGEAFERAVDIEVPLLQYAFGEKMPPIVPIVVGHLAEGDFAVLARALRDVMTTQSVIVVSSDFTHYGPNHGYEPFEPDNEVEKNLRGLMDRSTAAIATGERRKFAEYLAETGDTICGRVAIELLLETLPKGTRATRLHFDMSGAQMGDFENSVSYVAMAFVSDAGWPAAPAQALGPPLEAAATAGEDAPTTLTAEERAALLSLARRTIEAATGDGNLPEIDAALRTPSLAEKRAAFVTLEGNGELRGCIGSLVATESLAESVRANAVNAALHDPRFSPVGADEVKEIHIEISALTVPREVSSYKDIQLGRDGVILSRGSARAVYLPQVAPQQGWNLDQTLTHLSLKAGLSSRAWRDPKTRFEVFQAEVFGE